MTAFFRSTRLALLLGALASSAFGCTDDLTEIIVVVDSDMAVPGELNSITIQVTGLGTQPDVLTDLRTGIELPIWLGLVNDGDRNGPITVRVTGSPAVVAVRRDVSFQRGKTLMLRVELNRECTTTPSACNQSCVDGHCLVPWTGPPTKIDTDAGGTGGSGGSGGTGGSGGGGGGTGGNEDAGNNDGGREDAGDAGPIDPCTVVDAECFNYAPSNFDPAATGADALGRALERNGALNVGCMDAVFNSTTRLYSGSGNCSSRLLDGIEITQTGDVRALLVPLLAMVIGANGALRVVGDRPVIFAVFGNATLNGPLNASADRDVPGPGGNVACSDGNGQRGISQSSSNDGSSGGGGGAFGSVGGSGGRADVNGRILPPIGSSLGPSAAGGAVEGDGTIVPLRGGCAGGAGGQKATNGRVFGGAGGGAVQVSAAGSLTIAAAISAGGGGGEKALQLEDGGGGGGSGGAIVLEAQSLDLMMTAWLSVNGGGGGGGYDYDTVDANPGPGANAPPSSSAGGVGGPGDNLGGRGGDGAGATVAAQAGDNAALGNFTNGAYGAGGGGGGGGLGRIRLRDNTRAASTCVFDGNFSPAASVACGG